MIKDYVAGKKWLSDQGLGPQHLPHFFRDKLYRWQYEFITTKNRMALLCAANQVGKSTCCVKKNIWLATSPSMWRHYFPKRGNRVSLFWYFYPDFNTLKEEWDEKWLPLMPQVPSDHPFFSLYGWEMKRDKGIPNKIYFNSGVSITFRTYEQRTRNIQASTIDQITVDEELPEEKYGELQARLTATDGIFNSAFTATLGQLFWYKAMEKVGQADENFKSAFKRSVALHDCTEYVDGDKNTPWNEASIQKAIEKYGDNELEIKKRVYGRFITTEGRAFYAYNPQRTDIESFLFGRSLEVVAGVDPGTGGALNHPAAIVVVAVDYPNNLITLLNCWRGDGMETTSNDILRKYQEMTKGLNPTALIYDGASRDFFLTARAEVGDTQILPADKRREDGIERVNSYFEAEAFRIPLTRPMGVPWYSAEMVERLRDELRTVVKIEGTGKKEGMIDDLTDCLRYICMHLHLALDLTTPIKGEQNKKGTRSNLVKIGRGEYYSDELVQKKSTATKEIDYWNGVLGT